jgi:hypothetical protein
VDANLITVYAAVANHKDVLITNPYKGIMILFQKIAGFL